MKGPTTASILRPITAMLQGMTPNTKSAHPSCSIAPLTCSRRCAAERRAARSLLAVALEASSAAPLPAWRAEGRSGGREGGARRRGGGRTVASAGSRAAAAQPEEGSAGEEEERGEQGDEGGDGECHGRPGLDLLQELLPGRLERLEVVRKGGGGVGRAGA